METLKHLAGAVSDLLKAMRIQERINKNCDKRLESIVERLDKIEKRQNNPIKPPKGTKRW